MPGNYSGRPLFQNRLIAVALILILLLAATLRFHQLHTNSLWDDERWEARSADKELSTILSENPLALRLAVAHVFRSAGSQEMIFRLPYLAYGLLGIAMMFKVGKALFDGTVGVVAAFLLTVSAFHIEYSQEGRSYSLTVFLVLASLYCLYRALQYNHARHWAGFAILIALSMNNHVTAASAVASQVVYAVLVLLGERASRSAPRSSVHSPTSAKLQSWKTRLQTWSCWARSSRGAMLILSSVLGVLAFVLTSGRWFAYLEGIGAGIGIVSTTPSAAGVPDSDASLESLLRWYGTGIGLGLYLFAGTFVAGLVSCAVRRQWRQLVLAIVWILPPLLILPRVSGTAYFGPRHLIFLLPIYLLFVARGFTAIAQLTARYVGRPLGHKHIIWSMSLLVMLGVISGLSVRPVHLYYGRRNPDWRGAAAILRERTEPGDIIFYIPCLHSEALPFYLGNYSEEAGIELVDRETLEQSELPADVWWVMRAIIPGFRLGPPVTLESVLGSGFEVYNLDDAAVVRRKTPVTNQVEFHHLAARLYLVQALFDLPRWTYCSTYGLDRIYETGHLALTTVPGCPAELADPAGYVDSVPDQIEEGQLEQASNRVEEALLLHEIVRPEFGEINESSVPALSRLGEAMLAAGQYACALELYSRANAACPDTNETKAAAAVHWKDLGDAALKAREYAVAIAAYDQILEWMPDYWRAYVKIARAHTALDQIDQAVAMLEEAVKVAPGEPGPHKRLANTYLLLERTEEAVPHYRQVLQIDPLDVDAHYGLALAYDALGRRAEAVREFGAVIEIVPGHWLAQLARDKLAAYEQ